MAKDFRQNDRVTAMLPVHIEDGGVGVTRNLSPGGVYFVVDESIVAGQPMRFSLAFNTGDSMGADLFLECVGEVVRVEPVGEKLGIAVRLTESRLERRKMPGATGKAASK